MTLWINNGAVLKSSSQWQVKEFYGRNYLIFEIHLIAIDWIGAIGTLKTAFEFKCIKNHM